MRNRNSPQQKKQYSYAKDRRNAYGERAANSRHAIRQNKLHAERSRRHAENQVLQEAVAGRGEEQLAVVENRLRSQPASRKRFRKFPDAPLGEVVLHKLARRDGHRRVAAEPELVPPPLPVRETGSKTWKLNPNDVQLALSAGGSGGRTNYRIEIKLTHGPTGVSVSGESAKGNFTRARSTAAREQLYALLFSRLEQLVAKHLRLPGRVTE